MSWTVAMPIDELRQKGPSLLRDGKKQIAVFEVDDKIFATDNRCPHEGYPLREGAVDENCVLTCNWHNWKFDLKSGENLLGLDNVRSYPTKLEEGQVWIDLTDPPQSVIERDIIRALKGAQGRVRRPRLRADQPTDRQASFPRGRPSSRGTTGYRVVP